MVSMRAQRSPKFLSPRVQAVHLVALTDGTPDTLTGEKHHEGLRFTDVDVSHEDLAGYTWSECEFDGLLADGTDFQGARIVESTLTQFVAPQLKARRSTWKNVEISSSRLGAVEAYDAELSEVAIDGSKLGWVNLRAAKLRDVVFRNCRIEELDLSGASLTRVAFHECVVDNLVLSGAKAQHLDLRGLEFGRFEGLDGLRGARVSEQQGVELMDLLAAELGIEIEHR